MSGGGSDTINNTSKASNAAANVSFNLHDSTGGGSDLESSQERTRERESESGLASDVFSTTAALEVNNQASGSSSEGNSICAYLCIKVNKNREFMYCPLDRKMKNKLTSEFWFQFNDNR